MHPDFVIIILTNFQKNLYTQLYTKAYHEFQHAYRQSVLIFIRLELIFGDEKLGLLCILISIPRTFNFIRECSNKF